MAEEIKIAEVVEETNESKKKEGKIKKVGKKILTWLGNHEDEIYAAVSVIGLASTAYIAGKQVQKAQLSKQGLLLDISGVPGGEYDIETAALHKALYEADGHVKDPSVMPAAVFATTYKTVDGEEKIWTYSGPRDAVCDNLGFDFDKTMRDALDTYQYDKSFYPVSPTDNE